MKNIKAIFMGTPDFAVPVLKKLIEIVNVILVVSQPDKCVGRKKELQTTPIKKVAVENNIEVFQPDRIRKDFNKILELKPDIIITCAYGQIIPKEILECTRFGCINVHASLLPKLRGGAPIHKALIDGYEKTGITIMYMDEKMDTGDMISSREYIIKEEDNVGTLHDILSEMGASLLEETLPKIINGTNERTPQDDVEATYAYNIKRDEEHLDFNKDAREIFNQVRGLNPWPKANLLLDDEEIKVLECYYDIVDTKEIQGKIVDIRKDSLGITCNNGIVYLTKIKPFGKKEMSVRDYLNGINKNELLGRLVK